MKSIKQVIKEANELEIRTNTYLLSVGYHSDLVSQKFRGLINFCNSISIVFLHFNLQKSALNVLQKALRTDIQMFYSGDFEDKTWHGRVLIYCNLSYLFLKAKDLRSSLKFLYDSENLIIGIRECGKSVHDFRLIHAFLAFLAYFFVGNPKKAENYLAIAIDSFSLVSERFNYLACQSIYCLLEMSRVIVMQLNAGKIVSINEALHGLIGSEEEYSTAMGFLEKFKGLCTRGVDLIKKEIFYETAFLTLFFPFISENAPLISVEELEWAKGKEKKTTKTDLAKILAGGKKHGQDNYSLMMRASLEGIRLPHDFQENF